MHIAICVATFQRPMGLQRLLVSLNGLCRNEQAEFHVVIVDNDYRESARPVVDEISVSLNYAVLYIVEPRPGISYVRNTALEHALDADAIAFIDDDEEADPAWLDELIRASRIYSADIATGPVLPRFSCVAAKWIIRGGFFERPRPSTGVPLTEARTGNVLIRSDALRKTGIQFDPQFSLTGGEDADFFRRLNSAGVTIVAADAAIVYETIPASRANARWLSLRALRIANIDGHQTLKQSPTMQTRVALFASGGCRLALGAMLGLVTPLFGMHNVIRNFQRISRGLGAMMASAGLRYSEYKHKVHTVAG